MQQIKVTRTEVGFYTPDYTDDFYVQHEISSISGALEADRKYLEDGNGTIEEVTGEDTEVSYVLEIVEVEDDSTDQSGA